MSQVEAIEKVKSGEIAATALIAGKPVRSMSKLGREDGLHLVPIPYPKQFSDDYLPATLTHDDYPELVPAGESVDTVAVGAVLIAYNWPKTNLDRYSRSPAVRGGLLSEDRRIPEAATPRQMARS